MKSSAKIHSNEIDLTKNKASVLVKSEYDKSLKLSEENINLKAKIDRIKKKFKNRLDSIGESYDKKVIIFLT